MKKKTLRRPDDHFIPPQDDGFPRRQHTLKVRTKPLIRLDMNWDGEPPRVGHFLRSEGPKARTAYEIVAMRHADKPRAGFDHHLKLRCLRWPIADLPEWATIHAFRWNPRRKKLA